METTLTVSIPEAGQQLARLVDLVEQGMAKTVVIVRDDKPIVKLVPCEKPGIRIGIAEGKYSIPEPDSKIDEEIAAEFGESYLFSHSRP